LKDAASGQPVKVRTMVRSEPFLAKASAFAEASADKSEGRATAVAAVTRINR